MRRARARSEAGGWSDLAGAEEDYKALAAMMKDDSGNAVAMSAADKRLIAAQLQALPPRVKAAQERETAEMWGKLKEVSNSPDPHILSNAVSAPVRWACVANVTSTAGQWHIKAIRAEYGKLPDAAGPEDRRV